MNNTQRVNLTLTDSEVMRLKRMHDIYREKETRWNPSFTGFCAMVLMDTCALLENGVLEFGQYGNVRKTAGRPKEAKEKEPDAGMRTPVDPKGGSI